MTAFTAWKFDTADGAHHAADVLKSAEGDGLVVLEAMKMEHTLRAHGAGTVREIRSAPGQQVDVGDLLVELEPA